MMGSRLIGASLWLLATVLVAIATHLCAILILPSVATRDAAHRLAQFAATDHMALLPLSQAGSQLLPFADPATVQGVCFFDLANAPVRLKATVEEGHLLTLSFRTREGRIFYAMTDRAALHGSIDIRLVTEAQLQTVESGDAEDEGLPVELRLKAPSPHGMIVATALAARPADRQDAETLIKAITCHPETIGTAAR